MGIMTILQNKIPFMYQILFILMRWREKEMSEQKNKNKLRTELKEIERKDFKLKRELLKRKKITKINLATKNGSIWEVWVQIWEVNNGRKRRNCNLK